MSKMAFQTLFLDEKNSKDKIGIYMDEKGELFAGTDLTETAGGIDMLYRQHCHEMATGHFQRIADIYDRALSKKEAQTLVTDYKKGLPVAIDCNQRHIENHPAHYLNIVNPSREKGLFFLAKEIFAQDAELISVYERQRLILPQPKEVVETYKPFKDLKALMQ